MKRFQKLLEPGQIGKVCTRNRIIKNGTHLFYDTEEGYINERILGFYDVLAAGGVSLIVAPSAPLIPDARGYRIDDDKYIEGFSRLAQTIHKHGCPAFVQMFHTGPMSPPFFDGPIPVAASSIPKEESPRPKWNVARELTILEIEEIIERFAAAAERIRKAGFEGIELNSACNHLLNSFLSRAWNKRHDAYGCDSLENRTRIVVSIIEEVKRRNGGDFVIIGLMNGAEIGLKDGLTIAEGGQIARIFERAGADAIEVRAEYYKGPADYRLRESTHFPDIFFYPEPPEGMGAEVDGSHDGAGANMPLAAAMKKAVSIPVITVGRLDPELGEKALRRGMVDFISLNRPLLADPELPNKVAAGRLDDIAPCTACMTCFNLGERGLPVCCRINASLGREREYTIKQTTQRKRVMIVGGGPAGMEAARVAALSGHEVFLYEKEPKLGGSLPLAAIVKGLERENLVKIVRYLVRQIVKAGVTIKTGAEASPALIAKIKPDVLIVAAGGVHNRPDIPGIENPKVLSAGGLHKKLKVWLRFFAPGLLRRFTTIWMPLGKKVVIIGGGVHGCQVAEFLVKRGRQVTIVDAGKEIGEGLLEVLVKPFLINWLTEKGVIMLPEVRYEKIDEKGLVITTREGRRQTLEADSIITALPLLPNPDLVNRLRDGIPEVYTIGDAREPHMIIDAIAEGAKVARMI